jgi:radical SAM protein with 4Fe4S-binding SPASM domain
VSKLVKGCRDPWTEVDIQANGEVNPCCHAMLSMGSLQRETLERIWNGPRFAAFRTLLESTTPLPACATCFVRPWKRDGTRELRAALGRTRNLFSRLLHGATPHVVRVWSDRERYGGSAVLRLRVGVQIGSAILPRRTHLFLEASSPSGSRYWLHFVGRFVYVSDQPRPLLGSWEAASFDELELLQWEVRRFEPGLWRCTLALTPVGPSRPEPSTWLASDACAFRFESA